jgi:putative FmdB family regulatory protein
MPIYDYECENCGRFEKMQRISEEPLKECPNCHGVGFLEVQVAPTGCNGVLASRRRASPLQRRHGPGHEVHKLFKIGA